MFLPKVSPSNDDQRRQNAERTLLQMEAKIGGEIFGPLPKDHDRQFFCLDERTWIWHETWKDAKGKDQVITTRYDVRAGGVLKSQDGQTYQRISRDEARNLYRAVELYQERVMAAYQTMRQTGSVA